MTEQTLENLSALPKGWMWTSVGELYDIIGGGTPSTLIDKYWSGDIPWITSADIHGLKDIRPKEKITGEAIENSATNLVPEGSIIVVTRVGLGKVALTKTPICFSQDSQALVNNNNLLYPDYSLYYLAKAVQIFKYKHRGTTIAGVTKKQLAEVPFPLPPLQEQKHIVSKIEELFSRLDAGVEALKKAREQLKRYRQSVLKSAFEGRLTEQWRKENKDKIEPASVLLDRIREGRRKSGKKFEELPPVDTSELPQLPEGWAWTRLSEVVSPSDERYNPRESPSDEIFIGLEHIQPDTGKIIGYGHSSDIRSIKTRFHRGDVLYGKLRPYLNKVSVPDFDGICSTDILVFPNKDFIESKYLARFLMTSRFVRHASQNMSGVQHPRVSFNVLRKYVIPLAPYQEQKKISEEIERHLSITDNADRTIEHSLAQAERLKQTILKKAFEGKLVPQDPTDEPASVLLERIKAEKAEHEGKNKDEHKDRPKMRKRRNKQYRIDSRQRRLV